MRPTASVTLVSALTFLPLLAQAQGITGIRSGFVFDAQSKAIRPVNGLPGASTLGDPLSLDFIPDQVEIVSSPSALAYAVSAAGKVYQISLTTGQAGLIAGTQPDARLAGPGLLWSPSSRTVQLLPDGKQAFVNADGELTSAAIASATGCVLLAFDSGTLESVCADGNQSRLFNEPGAKIIAIAATKTAIFVQDATRVLQLTPEAKTIYSNNDSQYVGLTVLTENLLAVADSKNRTVTFLNLTDSNSISTTIDLLFAPTGLRHLDSQILQLGDAGANPFEVIDLTQQNRKFFIPAIGSPNGGQN